MNIFFSERVLLVLSLVNNINRIGMNFEWKSFIRTYDLSAKHLR